VILTVFEKSPIGETTLQYQNHQFT